MNRYHYIVIRVGLPSLLSHRRIAISQLSQSPRSFFPRYFSLMRETRKTYRERNRTSYISLYRSILSVRN